MTKEEIMKNAQVVHRNYKREWWEKKQAGPRCGLCKTCQEFHFLDEETEKPVLAFMCVNKKSRKVFKFLKHGVDEFACEHWEDINEGVKI